MGTMGAEDIHLDTPFSVECKSRKAFVAVAWMKQAERNAKGKTPIVVVHVHGSKHDEDLVMIRMKDYQDWYGEIK